MTLNQASATPAPAQTEIQMLVSQTKIATNLTHLAGAIVTLPLQATILLDLDDHAHAAKGGYAENDFARDIFTQSSTTIKDLLEGITLPLSNLTEVLEQLAVMAGEDPNWSLMQGCHVRKSESENREEWRWRGGFG
jgi:hypothetical protein